MYLQPLQGMQSSKLGLLKGYLFYQKCYIHIKGLVVGPRGILGDPGVDSGGVGKSKRGKKYGTKKSKERRQEPLGTMSYQSSSKRSPPFCLLIGQKNTKVFWHQSEVRTAAKREGNNLIT